MKKILRSTFATLVVTAFLAITPPMYARGGHGGGQGENRGHSGHGGKHAAAQFKGGHGHARAGAGHVRSGRQVGSRAHGGGARHFSRPARGHARVTGRANNWNWGGNWVDRNWGGSYWYPYYGYSRLGYYGYPGWYYGPYYGYYTYPYGYPPYLSISFAFNGY